MTSEPKRGDVWTAELDPTRGDEIRKTRPVVIVSDEEMGRLRLRIAAPVTDWDDRYAGYPWMVRVEPDAENGLTKTSAVDAFQVRSLSTTRLIAKRGTLPRPTVDSVADAIALCVGCSNRELTVRPPASAEAGA